MTKHAPRSNPVRSIAETRTVDAYYVTATGERFEVTSISSSTLTWPWGLRGPAVATVRDRGERLRCYLLMRSWRIRVPRRWAVRYEPWAR